MTVVFGATTDADGKEWATAYTETSDDLIELRTKHEDWHEGALLLLRYPTAPSEGVLRTHSGGTNKWRVFPGVTIAKDDAGNFGLVTPEGVQTA